MSLIPTTANSKDELELTAALKYSAGAVSLRLPERSLMTKDQQHQLVKQLATMMTLLV